MLDLSFLPVVDSSTHDGETKPSMNIKISRWKAIKNILRMKSIEFPLSNNLQAAGNHRSGWNLCLFN